MTTGATDIEHVLAEMQRANTLTSELTQAQVLTQAAQEQAALHAKRAADYAEQRLAVERGFFMDVGTLIVEVREQNRLCKDILTQTPLSEALAEFTSGAERAIRHINYQLEIVLRFMQSAIPYMSTMAKPEREELSQQLRLALNAPRLQSLQAQQREWTISLSTLQEQEAIYAGTPPVELINRLQRAQNHLEQLDLEIKALRDE